MATAQTPRDRTDRVGTEELAYVLLLEWVLRNVRDDGFRHAFKSLLDRYPLPGLLRRRLERDLAHLDLQL